MKYWLQTKAPSGNWVDNLGATKERCIEQGSWLRDRGETVRVIERTDREVVGSAFFRPVSMINRK